MNKKNTKLSGILKRLLFDREMKPIDLSREINIPQPTIHRLISGKSSRPYKSSLQPIADYFSISVAQLLGDDPIQPAQHQNTNGYTSNYNIRVIPLITKWQNTEDLSEAMVTAKDNITVSSDTSDKAFALLMHDSSMEPLFPRGCILIFDPLVPYDDRNYVLIKCQTTKKYVFRQLILDFNNKYIKSLNPDLKTSQIHLLEPKDEIIACLVESRNNYLRHHLINVLEEQI